MATVQQFINSTLRLIGVLDSGETPSTTESDDAFAALNQLLANWSSAGVPIYRVAVDIFPLTGALSYTFAQRPVKLKAARVTATDMTMTVEIVTAERWSEPKDRTMTSKFAQQLYYDGGYPAGTFQIWPNATGSTLEVYSLKPLTSFASLAATIDLPPGYEHALRFALASALAPEYGAVLSPELEKNATEAKAAIATLNTQTLGPPLPASGPAAAAVAPAA